MSHFYKAGLGAVGSYQVSGVPWITGSSALADGTEHQISFPTVTKSITVMLSGSNEIRVHFNSTGSGNVIAGNHFFPLTVNRDAITLNVKSKELFISNDSGGVSGYVVIGELTGIETSQMFEITGSGLTE